MGEPQKKYTNDKKRGHSDCCDLFWGFLHLVFLYQLFVTTPEHPGRKVFA